MTRQQQGAAIDLDQLRALRTIRRVFGDGLVEVLYVVPRPDQDALPIIGEPTKEDLPSGR